MFGFCWFLLLWGGGVDNLGLHGDTTGYMLLWLLSCWHFLAFLGLASMFLLLSSFFSALSPVLPLPHPACVSGGDLGLVGMAVRPMWHACVNTNICMVLKFCNQNRWLYPSLINQARWCAVQMTHLVFLFSCFFMRPCVSLSLDPSGDHSCRPSSL